MTNQIKVHVDAPAGLPSAYVTLAYHPLTTAEFEAVVEAAGGAAEFRIGASADNLVQDIDRGYLFVYSPKDVTRPRPTTDPFLAQYMARHSTPDAQERTEEMT